MKTLLLLLGCCLFLVSPLSAAETAEAKKSFRHVVCLKFKDTATKDDIKKVEDAFRALKTKIPEVTALEWGINNSTEKRNKEFTHLFFLTFQSEKDLATYIAHPEHQAFVAILKPSLADVFVMDYWAQP